MTSASETWDEAADVVVVGSGATGLPAAIAACEGGASVLIVEANFDIGGHAAISGGNVPLGGGTSEQKKYGIVDTPEMVFNDLTDWTVVQGNGFPDYRYNDREIIRAFADYNASTYDWLVAHGVIFIDTPPDNRGAQTTGNSAPREKHAAAMGWTMYQTGKPVAPELGPTTSTGIGLVRPLETSARRMGVRIMLNTRMASLVREEDGDRRVVGIVCEGEGGRTLRIRASKAVILGTGGSTSNVNFRRMFDPRLTEEYCGVSGEPFTPQDASGELAAMAVGASLWGAFNYTVEEGWTLTKAGAIGCQYGYVNLTWQPTSPVFHKARAIGLRVQDWQDVILVNMLGQRFYDETGPHFSANSYDQIPNYVPGNWRNARDIDYNPRNFLNAALAGIGDGHNGGGPIWAIFDSQAVEREKWVVEPPYVDIDEGFFASGNTLAELASNIKHKYQRVPMPPDALEATVARYNSFVDSGFDEDFEKPSPKYKILEPPFYAAWSTPVIHDSRAGLRIDRYCRVIDLQGEVIRGLYCGGESAGGFNQHGLARAVVQGRIAGIEAAQEKV